MTATYTGQEEVVITPDFAGPGDSVAGLFGNISWYLDPINGDDTNDGSEDYPFASFRCLNLLPEKIEHDVRIRPAAGTYDYFPRRVNVKNERDTYVLETDGGRLIIDASGETYPVVAGPYTIDTVVGIGPASPTGVPMATTVTVTGSPGWATDGHWGKWAHFTSGARIGRMVPIYSNAADTFETISNGMGIVSGDTFNIVEEPIFIDVDHYITFEGNQRSPNPAGLYMAGVRFRTQGPDYAAYGDISFVDIGAVVPFCSFRSAGVSARSSSLNSLPAPSGTFDNAVLNAQWDNSDACIINTTDGVPLPSYGRSLNTYESCSIKGVCCRGGISVSGAMGGAIANILCYGLELYGSTAVSITDIFVHQIGFADTALTLHDGYNYLWSAYIDVAGKALEVSNGAGVRTIWLRSNSIIDDYAVVMRAFSRIRNIGGANVDAVGAVGAIEFQISGTTHVAWPTSGNVFTDGAVSCVLTE